MKKIGTTVAILLAVGMLLVSCKQTDPLLDTYWIAGSDMVHFRTTAELDVYVCRDGLDGTKLNHYEYRYTWKYQFDGKIITATEEDGTIQQWTLKDDYMVLFEDKGIEVTAKKANF